MALCRHACAVSGARANWMLIDACASMVLAISGPHSGTTAGCAARSSATTARAARSVLRPHPPPTPTHSQLTAHSSQLTAHSSQLRTTHPIPTPTRAYGHTDTRTHVDANNPPRPPWITVDVTSILTRLLSSSQVCRITTPAQPLGLPSILLQIGPQCSAVSRYVVADIAIE